MWSSERQPVALRSGWSAESSAGSATPRAGWTPAILRSASGQELLVLIDSGVVALDTLSGADLAAAHDAGLVIVPDLAGQDVAAVLESGRLVPAARGDELIKTRDRAVGGSVFRRVERVSTYDVGMVRPGRLLGFEDGRAEDFGRAVAAGRGDERLLASDIGVGSYVPHDDGGVTMIYASTTKPIPPACRYIDVIVLGGGGGGAGGSQGAPGWDGNGGAAGTYNAVRWDRGPGRNTWQTLEFSIAAGGTGGPRNSGSGDSGGMSQAWIVEDGQFGVNAGGGSGGSGTSLGGGASGAQNGKAPGNYNFQTLAATGGGINGGVPGAGGRGGTGSFWPTNPGSGSNGARGQAWVRMS